MNKFKIPLIVLIVFFMGCKDDEGSESQLISKETLSGFVQKGPFINGTSITVTELDASLVQTGNTFNTQIVDNSGNFELKELTLSSPFVQLQADGFYFDEVIGEKSSAQLTLFALSDITSKEQINVNVLTHLEKGRVEFLIGQDVEFNHAKDSAQHELLSAFGVDSQNIENSEELDISINNSGNATLIAISIILQANNSVADLTELLANINTDFRIDGILNSESIKSELFNTTQNLNLELIRVNLEKRYSELGLNAEIADFESVIEQYLSYQKPFDINADVSNVTCNGLNDGAIDITVNEGVEPFTYVWSNGASTEDIENLAPGSYSVTITDANDYVLNKNDIVVSEPEKLDATFSVNHVSSIGGSDGSIALSVTGGTEPYSYEWSNSETVDNLQGLEKGFYTVDIQDANSCSIELQIAVQEPIELTIEKTDVDCFGEAQGEALLTISGGLEPYSIQWSNGSESTELSNLSAKAYSVTVTDELGYSVEGFIEIAQPNQLQLESEITHPSSNENGSISVTVSGGTPPYSFNWSNGSTAETSGQLVAFEYYSLDLEVTDANSCFLNHTFELENNLVDSRDGRVYKTVKIGDQIWMAENLSATKFNDDTNIENVIEGTIWVNLTSPAYCWYDNNEASYKELYGGLYNWYAVETNRLCPIDWHVPTEQDWELLENLTTPNGMNTSDSYVLRTISGWSPNSGTNQYGFSALPGGRRELPSAFDLAGAYGHWWSGTESETNKAYYRLIASPTDFADMYSNGAPKSAGYSVRCLKD